MNQYQFEQVSRRMAQRYGKIRKGDENDYMPTLFGMESNLLNVHRRYPSSNSLRLLEAIPLALHTVEGYLTGKRADVSAFESEDNLRLKNALLMAMDPFTNPEMMESVRENTTFDLSDPADLAEFFRDSVRCVLRIEESVKLWQKKMGSNGYFLFLEESTGPDIKPEDNMHFAVPVKPAKFKE